MHLMEAFTTLYETTKKVHSNQFRCFCFITIDFFGDCPSPHSQAEHRQCLLEVIDIINRHIIHPVYKTGIPQFFKGSKLVIFHFQFI
jgi:hypothetical protein